MESASIVMQKKIFLQIFLFFIILIISLSVYEIYFKKENLDNDKEISTPEDKIINEKISSLIQDLKYVAEGKNGDEYIVVSKFGELSKEKPNLRIMRQVSATINSKNISPIYISADNAEYNKVNYDTKFYGDVKISYDDNIISSNNMDLFFEKNFATIFNKISYKNLNTKLEADKIEIDLLTKNSKIFMYDKSKKIKIISLN